MDNPKRTNLVTKSLALMAIYSLLMFNVFVSSAAVSAQTVANDEVVSTPSMDKYTTDLTAQAASSKLRLSGEFEKEVDQLVKSLSNSDFRQPALLDQLGESQELVVEVLADRIAKGNVPSELQNKRVLMLEVASLFEGANTDAEVTSRMKGLINELASTNGKTILFVNELSNFVGSSQVNDLLASSIVNKRLSIIGGASREDYLENVDRVAEIAALFDPIMIGGGNQYGFDKNQYKAKRYRGDNVSSDIRELMKLDPNQRLDVILQTSGAENPTLRSIFAQHNVRLLDQIGDSDTIVVNMPLSAVEAISNSGLSHFMSPDRQMLKLGHIESATGASYARSIASAVDGSLDGTGVGIAIVDSGMKVDHKAFLNDAGQSRVVYSADFSDDSDSDDMYGHGTHVAGIAAGNSAKDSGAYKGIAPDADIINLKALDSSGLGQTSWLLAALDWVEQNHVQYNIRVVNLSLGGLAVDSYTNDPVNIKVQDLNALGILVVAAAGNEGKNANGDKLYGHIHSPGNDPSVLTVGAVNTFDTDSSSDDGITTFSSRGPTRSSYIDTDGSIVFDNAIKPDVVAPGNKIVSAQGDNTYLAANYASLRDSALEGSTDDNMMYMSGTSMAAPMVAGAAALLFELNPNLTPQMVKMIFQYSAQPLSGFNAFEQGAGQMNIEGAVRMASAYRTDIDFNTAASGMYMIASGQSFPVAQTTINGNTFSWSQGITTNHGYIQSNLLPYYFNNVYRNGSYFEEGVENNSASHAYVLNSNFHYGMYMNFRARVVDSDGTILGGGNILFGYGVLVSDGVLISDGVLLADGVLMSDGVLVSDGVLMSDGVLVSDRMSADGVLMSDGVLVSDRMTANGVLMSDGVLISDRSRALAGTDTILGE